MSRTRQGVQCGLTVIALCQSVPCSADGKAECSLRLELMVVDELSAEGLSEARIRLRPAKATRVSKRRQPRQRRRSRVGRYSLEGLCAGVNRLFIEHRGYRQYRLSVRLPRAAVVPVALSPKGVQRLADVVVEAPAASSRTQSAVAIEGVALERTRGKMLAEALSEAPGVSVLRSGANAKPIVRGQFGRRLLTLFDGVRHEAQKWGLEHAPEIDSFAADRLIVVKGAASVRYGPDAVGGAIVVLPAPLRRNPGYGVVAHAIGNSNARGAALALRIDAAHRWWPGFAWRLEGNFSRAAAIESPDYPLDNTGTRIWNLGATIGYRRRSFDFRLSYRRYQAQIGVFSGLQRSTLAAFLDQIQRAEPRQVELFSSSASIDRPLQQVSHDLLLARTRLELSPWLQLSLSYALQQNLRTESDVVPEYSAGVPQLDFDLQSHSWEAVLSHRPLPIGGQWRLEGEAGLSVMLQRHVLEPNGAPALIPSYSNWALGLFAMERLVGRRVDLELGLRLDHIARNSRLTRNAYDKHSQADPSRLEQDDCTLVRPDATALEEAYRCPTNFRSLTALLGGRWRIGQGYVAQLSASSAARAPFVDEQYIDGSAPSSPIIAQGDPSLGVETTWGLSASLSGVHRYIDFDVSAYFNWINDYIYLAPQRDADGNLRTFSTIRGEFPLRVHRPIDAVFYGVEASLTVGRRLPLQVDLRSAAVWAKDVENDAFLLYVPPLRVRFALTYKPPAWWRLRDSFVEIAALAVAKQTRVDLDADFAQAPDGYLLLGASAGTSIDLGQHRVAVNLQLSNLLNRRYRDYTSLLRYYADEPGRAFLLRLSYYHDAG